LASSSTTADVWEEIVTGAAAESPLWAESLRADAEREPVFSPLVPPRYAVGLETIYEGYLLHYGRPRLFAPADPDVALLAGDYLYAHGLSRIAALGELDAVAAFAELISTCAALRADGRPGDGDAWLELVSRLGGTDDTGAREGAVAAHAARVD
jgi:hypothetical protein